ncbi:hypothetical protein GOP47_0000166 [Adiantum capillus-veneris]|uniref:CRAL-TRIO domain-containing protein n=1 Tax=Adiantum capillus-veneris TaxID=13818 RepID=A0A9D4VEM3_ADICA|nr:hypothetical protein GOP47_0000166 [Adiantum capillus-veneris]
MPKKTTPTAGNELEATQSLKSLCVFRMAGSQNDEAQKVGLLRLRLQEAYPQSRDIDEGTLTRFLRARSHNVDKALKFLLQHLKWGETYKPPGYVQESEIANELKKDKVFAQGADKSGRIIVVILVARHFPSDRNLEEFKRFAIYVLDKLASISGDLDKFVLLADMKGFSYRNMDVKGFIACLEILQDHYPERLGKLFLLHCPSLFWILWRILYPFIDPNIREKIVFVDDELLKETLLKDIDITQLPIEYGGLMTMVPIRDVKAS